MAGGYVSGEEYTTDDPSGWSAVVPKAGTVLEVNLLRTSRPVLHETWAAFFIKEVRNESDGSYVLECHYIGCEDEVEGAAVSGAGRAGLLNVHMCLSTPCLVIGDLEALHTTSARFWDVADFKAEYSPKDLSRRLARWQKELSLGDALPKRRARAPAKPPGEAGVAGRKKPKEGATPRGTKKKPASAVPDGVKERLERKLKSLRGLREDRGRDKSQAVESVSDESGAAGSGEDSSGYTPTEPLGTGSMLEGVAKTARREKDPTRSLREVVPYEGTKGTTMKGLSGQLARKALAVEDVRAKAKKKRKKGKSTSSRALALLRDLILNKEGTEKKTRKEKDQSGKKKKKRRKLIDGVIVSSSTSSDDGSDSREKEDQVASSEEDMEAPMRRKSRDHPGSVLSMLTEHVRSQMDQDSVTEVSRTPKLTRGVKVTSFFNLHIRPSYGSHLKELREMYTLAMTIDLLRKGELGRVGDSLSARFMALHQSLIDQSWATARHMELFPLEESTAASSALVLASRKHQRLVDKVQGKGGWTPWQQKGKGNPRQDWSQWSEGQPKGKKGKGNQNKGKGKAKGSWNQPQDKGGTDWEKNKEKAEGTK